jgi:hypothetical protein
MQQRWKRRPEGSNWGDFGPDDQLGRINLITREKLLQGIAEVKEGVSFCLSLPLDLPGSNRLNPRRYPPRRFATLRDGKQNFNFALRAENPAHTDVVCDETVLLYTQYSTQWDSFAHVGAFFDADDDGVAEPVFYNGWRSGEHVVSAAERSDGEAWARFEGVEAKALGIETMAAACVQGRAVMIDLHAHFGRERKLVGYEDLMRICDKDRVTVEPGDMVCLHTGFGEALIEMGGDPDPHFLHNACAALDGRDHRLLQWITDTGLSILAADNYAVEALPSREPQGSHAHAAMPIHEHCLFKLGVHLGELWYLTELAAFLRQRNRSRFLLTAPPLRLPGAVGSPATPVATA